MNGGLKRRDIILFCLHNTDRCALLLLYLSECCDIVGMGLYHNKYKPKKPNIERATLVCEK